MLTMCVHTCKTAQNYPVLDHFETLNWCENKVQDILCDSNYIKVDRQIATSAMHYAYGAQCCNGVLQKNWTDSRRKRYD